MWRQRAVKAIALLLLAAVLSMASGLELPFKRGQPSKSTKSHKSKLPPTQFVRIFALPSLDATQAQHRIGELLASACRNHARVGGCKLHSATEANHHLRMLEFKDGKQRSIVAYMLQDNEQGIQQALDECAGKHDSKAANESGKDYKCYRTTTSPLPTGDEVLSQLRQHLEQLEVREELAGAPHKAIFLAADPRLIVYQEASRSAGSNQDPDYLMQKIRDTFRYTVEWLSWQYQQFITLTNGIPVLVSHAEDLDHNEVNEFQRILDFLKIDELHAAEETVTAKRGEIRFQRDRVHAGVLALPKALLIQIEEFLQEAFQDDRMLRRYSKVTDGSSDDFWPPPDMLHKVSMDNTVLVTAATCAYAPLIINWIKHIHDMGIPCYMVVALDDEIYSFLHNWLPDHVARAPDNFIPANVRIFAESGTVAAKHVNRARSLVLKGILDQGYNAAWADADVAVLQNVFTAFPRSHDFVGAYAAGGEQPLPELTSGVGSPLKLDDKSGRHVSTAFVYLRASDPARILAHKWVSEVNKTLVADDGAVLNELLHNKDVTSSMSVMLLPEASFPPGAQLFAANASSAYQEAWTKTAPMWAHPDSQKDRAEKIDKLVGREHWKVVAEDPMPQCARPTEEYLPDGTAVPAWPPAETLAKIAIDNTVLVTSGTCAYADLLSNWIKHTWDLGISCFLVATVDDSTAKFLEDWIPEHTARAPSGLVNKVKKFAQRDTPEYTKVVQSKPRILRTILTQGYNAAWSDADVAWLRNPFTLFDKTPDLVVAWANASMVTPGGVYQRGTFPSNSKGRAVGTGFMFTSPTRITQRLMERWAEGMEGGNEVIDDAAVLNRLLREPEFADHMTIGVFPSSLFPTGEESSKSPPPKALKEAWEDEPPAWLHADTAVSHDSKVKLLRERSLWRLTKDDPQPKCWTWGRKLGDKQGEGRAYQLIDLENREEKDDLEDAEMQERQRDR